jgi:hypothetical protein
MVGREQNDISDLSNELFEASLVALRNYDTEYLDSKKIYNFSKKGAKNHCQRLIEYYTTKCRGRAMTLVVNGETECVATTMSMDQNFGEDSTANLHGILSDGSDLGSTIEERQWCRNLLSRVPQGVGQVVKVVLGEPNDAFESWLVENSIDICRLSEQSLTKRACQFFDVPIHEVRTSLQQTHCMRLAS